MTLEGLSLILLSRLGGMGGSMSSFDERSIRMFEGSESKTSGNLELRELDFSERRTSLFNR